MCSAFVGGSCRSGMGEGRCGSGTTSEGRTRGGPSHPLLWLSRRGYSLGWCCAPAVAPWHCIDTQHDAECRSPPRRGRSVCLPLKRLSSCLCVCVSECLFFFRKAPIGVGHALFVLSDDQLTRIFTQPKRLCAVLSQIVCVCVCMCPFQNSVQPAHTVHSR